MEIQPIEAFVFEGIVQRFSKVFGCRCMITTVVDKSKAIEKFFDGKKVEYPFAFITIQNVAHNKSSYQSPSLTRRGLPIVFGKDQVSTARLLPTDFVMEVEFRTNQFTGIGTNTVLGYARRWLFAYKCGYLKFNIQYGQLEVRVGITMDESVPTPPLENKVETEAVYKITSNFTVHGWTSEPILGSQGVINELDVQTALGFTNGTAEGYQFVPFN